MEDRICVFIPAYEVEKTISAVIEGVRKELPDAFILVIDDCSKDRTYEIAKEYEGKDKKLKVIHHDKNRGYGGVQKTAFKFAFEGKFNICVMIHGDGQHNPIYLKDMINKIKEGYEIVLGSRMKIKENAISGGMPKIKFIGNIILSKIENLSTGLQLSEFHSGYRAFSSNFIQKIINQSFLECMSDDYIFDQQILFFAVFSNSKVGEIPVDTKYNELSRQMTFFPGIVYSLKTIKISLTYFLFRKGILKNPRIFLCEW